MSEEKDKQPVSDENIEKKEEQSVSGEKVDEKNKVEYPSARLLLESCLQDYQRVQENYNKIYEKISIALAFAGVLLTIMLETFDFSTANMLAKGMKIWEIILVVSEVACMFGGLVVITGSIIYLLILLRGRTKSVFKSEDIRNFEIYKEKEEYAAVWLIDKYTQVVNDVRPVVQQKQKGFDRALFFIVMGIVMYVIAIVLRKGGF